MDETTEDIIERITVHFPKPTQIHSGHTISVFYDCIQLSPNELARLAAQTTGHLPEGTFDVALGLAYSGILFASAVAGGKHVAILQRDGKICGPDLRGKEVVVVDDVVHTGRKIKAAETQAIALGAKVIGFACIVDRSNGKLGDEKKPLWSAYQTGMQ